jgi:lipopolysaccharide transport system ATP-binding protein
MSSERQSDQLIAVRARGLGKKYRIGGPTRHDSLRDALANLWQSDDRRFGAVSEFWALRDIEFEIRRGEVVGLIGRNGAGKSTLLKILTRVTSPSTGWLEGYGRVGSLLEVGTGFHPDLTGRDNVYLSGAILGMRRAEIDRNFDAIADFAEIHRFLDTPVKHYSNGMFVRLGFAVAAHLDHDILVIDEVLAVGDAAFQAKCLAKIREIAASGRTVLLVSHNMGSIRKLCERALWLDNGTMVADGAPDAVVARYLESMQRAAAAPLHERTDRSGNGRAQFTRVCLTGSEGKSRLSTGTPFTARFEMDGACAGVSCTFMIYDSFGQPVTEFDSAHSAPGDSQGHDADAFECHVDELLLLPGTYRMDAALLCDGEVLDHVEAIICFEVESSLLRGRALSVQSGCGSIQLPHIWERPCG